MKMKFLAIHFIFIFLLHSSQTSSSTISVLDEPEENETADNRENDEINIDGSVLYCDGIFQLINRTDESDKHCKSEGEILTEHVPCNNTPSGEDGLTCGGECVGFGDWCVKGTPAPTKCGYHLQDPEICRNKTFWEKQECPKTSPGRCTGWWPGQCEGDDGCRDKSNDKNNRLNTNNDNTTCPYKDKIINITLEFLTCPDKYNSKLMICAKRCDRVNDGCEGDSDEKDCVPVISNITLGVAVVVLIVVTIVSAEVTIWAVKGSFLGKDNKIKNEKSTDMKEKTKNEESTETKKDAKNEEGTAIQNETKIKESTATKNETRNEDSTATKNETKNKDSTETKNTESTGTKKEAKIEESTETKNETKNEASTETKNKEYTETKNIIKENVEKKKMKMHKWVWFKKRTPTKDNEILQEKAMYMDKLFDMLLDPNNWHFGELHYAKWTNFTNPHWSTGDDIGFTGEMDTLKKLYYNFRKMVPGCQSFLVRRCECPRCMCFRFFLYAIPHKYHEDPKKKFEKMPHYVFDLIYKDLEDHFLRGHDSQTQDIDLSIKNALGNRESGTFYGHIYPYLHIPSLLLKLVSFAGVWIDNIEIFIGHIPYYNYVSYLIAIILAIAGFYVDFMKDVLIANHVSFLYTTFWDFKSQIVLLLWATIFVNQTIIGVMIVIKGPTKLFDFKVDAGWKRWLIRFMFLLMSPLSPTLLLYMNARATVNIKRQEKRLKDEFHKYGKPQEVCAPTMDNLEMYHKREQMVVEKRKMEAVIGTSYIIGILYENTPQILVQVLIVLLSLSAVTLPEMSGIEAIWDTRDGSTNIGEIFFFFSIIWSLIGIITSLVSTFLYRKEFSIGDLGKILIFLQMSISTSLRLICIILYIAPSLGLLSILLHYQIEQTTEYSPHVLELLKRKDQNFIPKLELDWYLLMNRAHAMVVFFFFPLAHAAVVLIYKTICVDDFNPKKVAPTSCSSGTGVEHAPPYLQMIYRRILHAFSSLLCPDIFRDWDIPLKSTKQDYQKLCMKVMLEYFHMSILFFIENILLLVPLLYTCGRVLQRHASLQFPLEEEQEVVTYCYYFLCFPLIVLILSCLHFLIFIVYNISGHPWSILLSDKFQICSVWCDLFRCRVDPPPPPPLKKDPEI